MSDISGHSGKNLDQDLVGKAKEIGGELKSKAAEVTGQATEIAKEQMSQLGTTAKDFAADATSKAQAALDEQRSLGAEYVASVAGAVERAANEFDNPVPFAARYMRETAHQIENVAGMVRDRNLRELVGEAENLARRQPALFFGGAMLLGFAALRFLKSAPDNAQVPVEVKSPSMTEFDDFGRHHTEDGA